MERKTNLLLYKISLKPNKLLSLDPPIIVQILLGYLQIGLVQKSQYAVRIFFTIKQYLHNFLFSFVRRYSDRKMQIAKRKMQIAKRKTDPCGARFMRLCDIAFLRYCDIAFLRSEIIRPKKTKKVMQILFYSEKSSTGY